jgi:tetratricopeptide (TPR) repeat protein
MKIRLVTVVWGREFVEIFLRIGLRTLLAGGNAPALAQAHQVTYTIYTTPEDRQRLEVEPAFTRLREALDVQFSLFGLGEIDGANPSSHGIFWYRAIALARRRNEVLFFIMPDVLYARGTLLAWARRFESGARAVFTVGPRVALETALPELEARFPARHEPCDLSREEMLELLYRHFHPAHAIMRRDSSRRFAHPEYDLRVVPGQGVIIREMVSHPFCLDPGYFSNFRYFAPEDHLESLAFEPCSTVSAEPLLKFIDQWYRPWPLDELRMSNLGGWWNWHTTRSGERESEFPFELFVRPGSDGRPHSERDRAIAGGRFYRSQVVISGKLFQLFVALRERGFTQAAGLLAAAVYAGRLRRRVGLRRGAILLVPTDVAVEADRPRIRELLLPGKERELLDLVSDHVVLEQDELRASRRWRKLVAQSATQGPDVRPLFTARGEPAEALLSGLTYAEPFSFGSFTIYPIDHVLWRDRAETEPAAVTACDQAPLPSVAAEVPDAREQRQPAGWISPGSAPRRALRHCRRLLRAGARRGIAGLAYVSRRANLVFEDVPLIGRLTHLCTQVLNSILRDGFTATFRRIAWRLGIVDLVAWTRRRSEPYLRLPRTANRAIRRYGLSATMQKAVDRATVAASEQIKPPIAPSGADAEILDEVRRLRALQAVEQVMADFVQRLDIRDLPSIPLAFVREKLNELAKVDGVPPSETLATCLRELTQKYPAWADAWLELGFLHQDEGHTEEALDCFERAMHGRLGDTADRRHNPIAIAAANRGRLLTVAGQHAEALASFAFCLRHDPEQAMVSVEYAEALRRAGQPDSALVNYAHGMYYRPPEWKLPRLSRNATDMTFRRLASNDATLADKVMRASAPGAGQSTPGAAVEAVN